ncbi:hypothetical protein J2810_000311 [Chryseobacterium rhizosphaerae]|uniref:cell wall anchor protein n=1 Tax=Chryseobacterium rhizosphaerae TaxID=395937 RepID=UPI0028618E02|nr:cell wall anchor protein [Chryseobacterium rhizosphaerae]MDR6544289.1 hypothetical protein [Chryseobacterium rhizosphaerae]
MKIKLLSFALLASIFTSAQTWNTTGNSGTNPATNFLGTADVADLILKTNNTERLRINSTGNIAIGGTPDDVDVPFQVYGRTQFKSNINSDGVQIRNMAPNLNSGLDLLWLTYDHYQPNDVGLLTLSVPPSVGDWSKPVFSVRTNGKVHIGTSFNNLALAGCSDCSEYRLFVKDGIKTEKVKVESPAANGWADYVFKKDYKLRTLDEVEKHIQEKGHLPNIPSAKEVDKEGINLGEMDAKLLEKIEELTLYSIEQNKQLKFQEEQLRHLQEENKTLKSQSEDIKELKKQVQQLLSTKK